MTRDICLRCNLEYIMQTDSKIYTLCINCLNEIAFNYLDKYLVDQPERSKREDSNKYPILIDPKTNEAYIEIPSHIHSLGQYNTSLLEYKFEMRCSEHCGNTVRDK